MNTHQRRLACIHEMQYLRKSPRAAVAFLRRLKAGGDTGYMFANFTNYYLSVLGYSLRPLTHRSLLTRNAPRLSLVQIHVENLWRSGIIGTGERRCILIGLKLIDSLIRRYRLLYVFL